MANLNSRSGAMRLLAKETAIYGLSSIIGKFLNWLLVPLYTYVLAQQSDYGIVTNLYAWTALLLVILTYGMETGFFRFANKEGEHPLTVYRTAMISIGTTSLLFAVLCCVFSQPIARWLGYADHAEFIALLAVVVAMDAFASIPFAYLRYKKQAIRFAALKLLFVFLNIVLNIFFLVLCPLWQDSSLISSWYDPNYGVGYVFIANILATGIQTLCLLPSVFDRSTVAQSAISTPASFSCPLLKQMLRYSLPLLVLGVCGIMNQTLDRIIFPFLYTAEDAQAQLGIYGACFKVAMVMRMFTQAFRYAYEPFVFSKQKEKNSLQAYADAMKWYVYFSLLILLGMVVYMDLLRYLIAPSYWEGLRVIPIVLWTYVFQGVYFNLSFWYKLTDKTQWGAWFSLIGLVINLVLQIVLVPRYGYMASACAAWTSYFVIMLLSYFVGQRHMAIPYDLTRIFLSLILCLLLLAAYSSMDGWSTVGRMAAGTGLIAVYIGGIYLLHRSEQRKTGTV